MNKEVTHKEHYVYIYLDPRKPGNYDYSGFKLNYEPFYIGSGKGERWSRHLSNFSLKQTYNEIKNRKIKIISKDFDLKKYVIFYKTNLTKKESLEIEKEIIIYFGRIINKTGILTNITDDYSLTDINYYSKGKTYEELYGEEKAKQLKELRRKQLLGNSYGKLTIGRKHTEETKKKLSNFRKKKVKQLDLEMNLIKIWNSSKDAANELNIYVGTIHNVLGNQKNITAGGFKWEYVEKENIKYKII